MSGLSVTRSLGRYGFSLGVSLEVSVVLERVKFQHVLVVHKVGVVLRASVM